MDCFHCGRGWSIIKVESVKTVVTAVVKLTVKVTRCAQFNRVECRCSRFRRQFLDCEQNKIIQCQCQHENQLSELTSSCNQNGTLEQNSHGLARLRLTDEFDLFSTMLLHKVFF